MYEVESIMNSRPITIVSSDPRDPELLTPNHLLPLRSVPTMPTGYLEKTTYCHVADGECPADIFWKRWSKEYLLLLISKLRGFPPRRNLAIGDVVLVSMENSHCNSWPMKELLTFFLTRKDSLFVQWWTSSQLFLRDRLASFFFLLKAKI